MRARVHVLKRRVLATLLVLNTFLALSAGIPADAKTRKPSVAEINEAKQKEAEKKAAADRAKAKLNAASNQLKILTAKAVAARNRYLQEVKKLEIATKKAEAARKKEEIAIAKSNKAQGAVVASKNHIGKVADRKSVV